MRAARAFLTAEWRYLAMLNYRVAPELLLPHVPRGTTLDHWQGATYVSVVGLLFRDTRLLGVPVPFHRTFEEVNLRFYVRREVDGEVRRAVTFVKELVPRRAIAAVARLAYNEPYEACPMRHRILHADDVPALVEYAWRQHAGWSRLVVEPIGRAAPLQPGTETAFITEHYWGYTRQRDGGTVEYRVEHPAWRVWPVRRANLEGPLDDLYGPTLGRVLAEPPGSAFLAEGSPETVYVPQRLPAAAA